jgi:hypothetical protein
MSTSRTSGPPNRSSDLRSRARRALDQSSGPQARARCGGRSVELHPGRLVTCVDPGSCMIGECGEVMVVTGERVTVRWRATGTIGRLSRRALVVLEDTTDTAAKAEKTEPAGCRR